MAKHFHHLLTCHHFLNESIHLCQVLLLSLEMRARHLTQLCRCKNHHDGHKDGNECHGNAQYNHGSESNHDGNDGTEGTGKTLANHLSKGIHIIRIGGHDVAMRMRIEILDGQRLHV